MVSKYNDLLNDEWDLDASASDNESFEIEMSQDDLIRIPNIQQEGSSTTHNHIRGVQPQDRLK